MENKIYNFDVKKLLKDYYALEETIQFLTKELKHKSDNWEHLKLFHENYKNKVSKPIDLNSFIKIMEFVCKRNNWELLIEKKLQNIKNKEPRVVMSFFIKEIIAINKLKKQYDGKQ